MFSALASSMLQISCIVLMIKIIPALQMANIATLALTVLLEYFDGK